MPEKITNYDNATVGSGSVVNEVVFEYNDLGMLAKEYQEHEGAKDGNTLYVQYNFDTSASGGKFTKGLRPSSVRYPNGRLVHFTYGSADSTADALNRLDAIKDDSGGSPGSTLASYSYLGLGTIVIEDYEQPDVRLEYFFDSAYSGFDRFGRVVDQRWYDYGASADRDRYTYGYDRASNRTYRENTIASAKDEFYTYDAHQSPDDLRSRRSQRRQDGHLRHAGPRGGLGPRHDRQLEGLPPEDVRLHGSRSGPHAQQGQRDQRHHRDGRHRVGHAGA